MPFPPPTTHRGPCGRASAKSYQALLNTPAVNYVPPELELQATLHSISRTQPNTPAGNSRDPGASAPPANLAGPARTQPTVSSSNTAPRQSAGSPGVPIGIPPKGCVMVPKSAFATAPTMDLSRELGGSQNRNHRCSPTDQYSSPGNTALLTDLPPERRWMSPRFKPYTYLTSCLTVEKQLVWHPVGLPLPAVVPAGISLLDCPYGLLG